MKTMQIATQYNPVPVAIKGQILTATEWEADLADPEVSYLRRDNDGNARCFTHLPHIPTSEYKTAITFTFRGEDAIRARQALQSLMQNAERSREG